MKNSFLENLNQGVLGLKPYEPGLPLEQTQKKLGLEKVIKLASNENPLGPSPKSLDLLKGQLNSFSSDLNRYPDGNAYDLKEAISKKYSEINNDNRINDMIEKEFKLILKSYLLISKNDALLSRNKVIENLIRFRNPTTDLLNIIQIE